MDLQEMKKLESEVRGLQYLMREVHRNQVELNRVLLNRNVCPGSANGLGGLNLPAENNAGPPRGTAAELPQAAKVQPPEQQTKQKRAEGRTQVSPSTSSSKQQQGEQPGKAEDPVVGTLQSEMQMVQQEMGCAAVSILSCPKIYSRSSSFIRNILDEDCRAGVAVIDLFVTVKMAKDNLNSLSKSNSEACDKIIHLNKDTLDMGKGYKDLVEEMRKLLVRMNETIPQRKKLPAAVHLSGEICTPVEEKPEAEEGMKSRGIQAPSGSPLKGADRQDAPGGAESCSWADRQKGETADGGSEGGVGCIGCFVSSHKAALFDELPELSEESFASFLETLFLMQKGKQNVCEICNSSLTVSQSEDGEREKEPDLSESAFRIFCDICEILDGAAREDLGSEECLTESEDDPESLASCTDGQRDLSADTKSTPGMSCLYPTVDPTRNHFGRKSLRSAIHAKSSKRETKESESETEEGATDPALPLSSLGLKVKPSVTCMGDLTRTVPGKKSASTLTTASASSCRKLSSGIRSKIKRIISKKKNEQKSSKGSKISSGKGRPSADAPDKCKGHRNLGDLKQTTAQVQTAPASDLSSTFTPAPSKSKGEDCVSDDSFHNCDSESGAADSVSGDDDMEEFVEIFNECSRPSENAAEEDRGALWGEESQDRSDSFFGFLQKTTLKTIKGLLFEIQKCSPSYFVQEILPKTVKSNPSVDGESISLNPGENKEKRVVIEGSSTDFVIFIQVEMDESSGAGSSEFYVQHQASSLGTQTRTRSSENVLKPTEEEEGQYFYDVWEECRTGESEERERITFDEPGEVMANCEVEREIRDTYPDESLEDEKDEKVNLGKADVVVVRNVQQQADVWLLQQGLHKSYAAVTCDAAKTVERPTRKPAELERALDLIHEIENDVAEVKLGNAISILPRLEWELRRHLRSKMKYLGGKDHSENGGRSMTDFLPEEETSVSGNSEASERMQNLLMMLTELETAIKSNEHNGKDLLCQYDPSKVYKLLHALVDSIRGLQGEVSMANLSQTLDIASQLDTAVREYDSIIKKRPLDYLYEDDGRKGKRNAGGWEAVPAKQHLKNVRKKVFEMVEDEATQLEVRIERGFVRLNVLEKENDEAMTFLEAFLQKTKRRMSELTTLKSELQKVASSIREMHENLLEKIEQKRKEKQEWEKKIQAKKQSHSAEVAPVSQVSSGAEKSKGPSSGPKQTDLKETVSGLLIALDNLKSKAREKNELCREILCPTASDKFQARESTSSFRRSSRSSFTAKHTDTLTSTMTGFRKIGENSLYLAWSSPEGSLKDYVTGYEIYVNGKLNQKVRNSRRLQAVLYSVDFSQSLHLELYAITENYPKMLMISKHYNVN